MELVNSKFTGNGILLLSIIITILSCNVESPSQHLRPDNVWIIRSVLDDQPRMISLALDQECYMAYDLERCGVYKVWKGGIIWKGSVFSDDKNVQPTTWGKAYYPEGSTDKIWFIEKGDNILFPEIKYTGYVLRKNQIFFQYILTLPNDEKIYIEECPEFVKNDKGNPGIERSFKVSHFDSSYTLKLKTFGETVKLRSNKTIRIRKYFDPIEEQIEPIEGIAYDHMGKYWMEKSDCFTCHELENTTVGPSLQEISLRYPKDKAVVKVLAHKIKSGGKGVWGEAIMNSHPTLTEKELITMVEYILSLNPEKNIESKIGLKPENNPKELTLKPGFGIALDGLHPSYDISTLRNNNFKPKVGGLAFLPDGKLLVTTWNQMGEVYLLDGVEKGNSEQITIKRIASGLAEPLGIEVVDGEIFVLQKHELTQLIDLDGDGIIDEYKAICNGFGVTTDFHEFAFGLVYKEGYFYANLSLAMRLLKNEKQLSDRGKTIKIDRNGNFEWINHGLRQPNGIGLGVNDEIFITDNQGEWLPANKFIHLRKGDFHGMRWALKDSLPNLKMTPPTVWLPEHEIANSPSEPVLMKDAPFKGQMLYGDVSHGGIKRVFLEKINNSFQGAVFRFSQGFEAGINRMRWGPDGALYIGGVGMVGGWSWKENKYGLQRIKHNGKSTFELLAVRAKDYGFEIEFTIPLAEGQGIDVSDYLIQQWHYVPTANYGGSKIDLENLKISKIKISKDRTKISLHIPNLKEKYVVYILLKDHIKSVSDQSLWSGEAWYTLNNIPKAL
ncbi:MAG: c-type cytochrome [Flavobacteriaceae bacterium]